MMHDEKLTLTVEEAARLTGLGMNKMYELVHSKDFPKISVGKKILIIRSKFIMWLEENVGKRY